MIVHVDGSRIRDWDSFHDEFSSTLGFPSFYGRNLNAWIDCLTCVDDPDAQMTSVHVVPGSVMTIQIDNVDALAASAPAIYSALIECAAFVNWRRIERGAPPALALSFHRTQ